MTLRTSLLLAASLAVVAPATAQVRIYAGPSGGSSSALRLAERALRMREDLKLSAEQVSQLEAVRKEEIAREQELSSRVIALQSEMRAGKLEWEQVRDSLESKDDARNDATRAARDRARQILTEEQRDKIEEEWYGVGTWTVRPGRVEFDRVRPRRQMEYYFPRNELRPGRRFYRFDDADHEMFDWDFEMPRMEHFEFPRMEHLEFPRWENFELPQLPSFEFALPTLPALPNFPSLPNLPTLPSLPALPSLDWWHGPGLFEYTWDSKDKQGVSKLQRRGIF